MRSRASRVAPGVLAVLAAVALPSAAQQNLLTNGDFTTDVSGWTAAGGTAAVRSSLDANGAAGSGALLVTDTHPVAGVTTGAYQCAAVSPGQTYHLALKGRVPSGQASTGYIMGSFSFYREAGCASGSYINETSKYISIISTSSGRLDSWETASGSATAPAEARSVLIGCNTIKNEAGGSLQGLFDDVVLSVAVVTVPKTLVVPSSASIHGQNQTFFHTDLWVKNRSYQKTIAVAATYRCQAGFTCDDGSYAFTLAPRETLLLSDVVANAFHRPETAGAIELTWDSAEGPISALSRTYTPTLPEPTNGTSVPAMETGAATRRALFLGLGNNGADRRAGFRSNAGAYNRTDSAAPVTFRLVDQSGASLGETVRTAEPGQPFQINDVFAEVGAGAATTVNASLEVTSTVPVFPFVTVIDNLSGDSVWVPPSIDEAP